RLLCTLLVRGDQWDVVIERGLAQIIRTSPEELALRVRLLNVVMGLLLGALLWGAASSFFSKGAANLALALFALSPSLIAHFSLATTDGVVTLLTFASVMQLARWRRSPTRAQTLLLGLCLGTLLVSKFSAPPMYVLAFGFIMV